MDHDDAVQHYGPWLTRTPKDAAELLCDYPGRWWIAGGWALEAFCGVARQHDDIDPSVPRSETDSLRAHLQGRLRIWAADGGSLSELGGDHAQLAPSCENLWLRPDEASPWEYDVILMDVVDSTWTFKRDSRISLPLEEILWTRNGIDYLRPEVQLLHKAHALRAKDQLDFDVCAPRLDDAARSWLAHALSLAHPQHPWLSRL